MMIRTILKTTGILIIICSIACLFLFILGHFIPLHPHAYRDLIRSIVMVFAIICLFISIYKAIPSNKISRKISAWYKDLSPPQAIAESFTIITAINSLMMIIGYDIPKQEVFAYIHMMIRFFIISIIIIIIMWKDTLRYIKNPINFKNLPHQLLSSISKLFTFITISYCIFMIIFQSIIEPAGGILFYQILLGILAFSIIIVKSYPFVKRNA